VYELPELKYKRVLLKLSGEALAGEAKHGIDAQTEMEKKWKEQHQTIWECLQLL